MQSTLHLSGYNRVISDIAWIDDIDACIALITQIIGIMFTPPRISSLAAIHRVNLKHILELGRLDFVDGIYGWRLWAYRAHPTAMNLVSWISG